MKIGMDRNDPKEPLLDIKVLMITQSLELKRLSL